MLAKLFAGATLGLHGVLVEVEVDVAGRGFPTFTIVGLPSKAIDEAKERVRTAIANTGYEMPDSRITVNLAPADIPKTGTSFDLAISIGILAASGFLPKSDLKNKMFTGELSLEGNVRKVTGTIPFILLARDKGIKEVYIPRENLEEASIFDDIVIYPVSTLQELILHIREEKKIAVYKPENIKIQDPFARYNYDFSQIRGQEQAKRALEIAAAGFHNIHLKGPPGAGKTLLSRTMPTILPLMEKEEILEVAKIYSVVGKLDQSIFLGIRPFRSPHHTTSRVGLIGGGTIPMPGEISLAHRGVLFLDEFPEFPRHVLESMRQPMEDGIVTVSRAAGTLIFPSRFLLLAASNPCPCGFLGHPSKPCRCMPGAIEKYKKRLSGPLLDRIDLHTEVPPVAVKEFSEKYKSEPSTDIRTRVERAREKQRERYKNEKIHFNSEMRSSDVLNFCKMENGVQDLLHEAARKLGLSARSYFKTIKVGRTIADLEDCESIKAHHVSEALQYRTKE